jgi:hypothetical protein
MNTTTSERLTFASAARILLGVVAGIAILWGVLYWARATNGDAASNAEIERARAERAKFEASEAVRLGQTR